MTEIAAKHQDTAVVLLNMGGPERLEDVEPFLFNLFSDGTYKVDFTWNQTLADEIEKVYEAS